jgi:hypothetical protein
MKNLFNAVAKALGLHRASPVVREHVGAFVRANRPPRPAKPVRLPHEPREADYLPIGMFTIEPNQRKVRLARRRAVNS